MDRGGVIELWGGVECTVARIGDRYRDQLLQNGHHDRADDIARIASLGVRCVRYPVLWERVVPDGDLAHADWSWTDERLGMLAAAGVEPIVTLLHHGSGPPTTSLLDEELPQKLSAFARAVARRYPWVRRFTPVNEPLTTARFCALYGTWYPHRHDNAAFVRALFNQVRAIATAMNAIRDVTPSAELVQTEDLGHTSGTPELSSQVAFERDRRWATYDLLCGRVDPHGPFWRWVHALGFPVSREALAPMRSRPQIAGINYYVTSERFLDHRVEHYPDRVPGGEPPCPPYIDIEAVRVPEGLLGLRHLAALCWQRYGLPMAVTEAQLACTPDEQLRWIDERYRDCVALAADGVDLRAFTVWALFGAHDWNTCLSRENDFYEPGAFAVRDGAVIETGIAHWMRAVARGERYDHPALHSPGWWKRDDRVLYRTHERPISA